jgi:methionyl aminopeptidase
MCTSALVRREANKRYLEEFQQSSMPIAIRDEQAIKKIAIAGNIIFEIFAHIDTMELSGMQTIELNDKIHTIIKKHSATPAFLDYRGFPKSACVSLNNEVVHGIPGKRTIQDGDLVKIDVGVNYQGYIADAAKTFAVGKVSDSAKKLMAVTKHALRQGIAQAQKGKRISDISRAVQTVVEKNGFSVVRELTGHGVGENLHEEPMIPNFVTTGDNPEIQPGMVFAIEPMVNSGDYDVVTAQDGWAILTKDGSLSCHFEDTIAVLEHGNINLTRVAES